MSFRDNAKALSYIQQLNTARCNGQWEKVPELVRKVEKHAPHRKCLAATARTEAQVTAYDDNRSAALIPSVVQALEVLIHYVNYEGTSESDKFEGSVCLGWAHWTLGAEAAALSALPVTLNEGVGHLVDEGSAWTLVCAVKAAYVKGCIEEANLRPSEAAETYSSVVALISGAVALGEINPQLRLWAERLLSRLSNLEAQFVNAGYNADRGVALRTFRLWTRLVESPDMGEATSDTGQSIDRNSARMVWKAYYEMLSSFLQNGVLYGSSVRPVILAITEEPPGVPLSLSDQEYIELKLRQIEDLKHVEATYEALLLKETRFPKANESNQEITEWVETVMGNWRVLCGPNWQDEELGEGGKVSVGRNTLDILYRAAAKSFHSTQILRHLFTVHSSLAEFVLALKAFDSYVEIVTKGKVRAEKAGEPQAGLDDDDTAIRTAAQAIRILCRYGTRREAEKASDLGNLLEKWVSHTRPKSASDRSSRTGSSLYSGPRPSSSSNITAKTLAIAYRAMGISKAHWARLTYETGSRADFQARAIEHFQASLAPELGDTADIESLYSLAMLLAETRDIDGAITAVKQALTSHLPDSVPSTADGAISEGAQGKAALKAESFARERSLVPVWHLLALLLSAKHEFEPAMKACEAAFEQFVDSVNLFGEPVGSLSHLDNHLNGRATSSDGNKVRTRAAKGLVDYMPGFEKGTIVQIKMTQLSLLEVLEDPDTAVNASDELLGLYARLFGDPKVIKTTLRTASKTAGRPQSIFSTVKTSIFRRSMHKQRSMDGIVSQASSYPQTNALSQPTTAGSTARPTIEVIRDDGTAAERFGESHQHHHLFHRKDRSSHHGASGRSSVMEPGRSVEPQAGPDNMTDRPTLPAADVAEETLQMRPTSGSSSHYSQLVRHAVPLHASAAPDGVGPRGTPDAGIANRNGWHESVNGEQPLRDIPHNFAHTAPPLSVSHSSQTPRQDTRLPAPFPQPSLYFPEPLFPTVQERRHKISLLINVWLFTARLYARASMFEDARGAIYEAYLLIEAFEVEVAQEESSRQSFAEKGWGAGKAVDELWADMLAERASLLQYQGRVFEAIAQFEAALAHFPDHPVATVGLSNLLLDIYCQVIPSEPPENRPVPLPAAPPSSNRTNGASGSRAQSATSDKDSPQELNRLAARDRAYSLLSTLTRLGSSWDNSEAWFTLARAYEESGQIEKAKEVLWWCVELEDTRPLRHWSNIGSGGYVL